LVPAETGAPRKVRYTPGKRIKRRDQKDVKDSRDIPGRKVHNAFRGIAAARHSERKKNCADRMAGEGRREARSALLRGMGLLNRVYMLSFNWNNVHHSIAVDKVYQRIVRISLESYIKLKFIFLVDSLKTAVTYLKTTS